MDESLKSAVVRVYGGYAESPDAIVCEPALASRFAHEVNLQAGLSRHYPQGEVSRCLLNLRKRQRLPKRGRPGGR